MQTSFCAQVCFVVVLLCLSLCGGTINSSGHGKFQTFNGNRFSDAKSISQNGLKSIFNRNRARPAPPAHDTPASSCSCRKSSPQTLLSSFVNKNTTSFSTIRSYGLCKFNFFFPTNTQKNVNIFGDFFFGLDRESFNFISTYC